MSYNKIQEFLVVLASRTPQKNAPFMAHCNDIWVEISPETDFLEFQVLVEAALQSSQFLNLTDDNKESLLETLVEVKAAFNVSVMLANAPDVWQRHYKTYPLLARSIRQGVSGDKLTHIQEKELDGIEDDLKKLKATSDNAAFLDFETRDAIGEITDLLNSAIDAVRKNGLTEFTLNRPFLFGNLSLIFHREKVDFGDVREDIIQIVKRIWAFGNVANTSADIYGKLISMVG